MSRRSRAGSALGGLALSFTLTLAFVAEARFGVPARWRENQCAEDICLLDVPPLRAPVVVLRHQACLRDNYANLNPLLERGEVELSGARVLDVATGTGAMALLAAHHGAAQVVATEIHPVALLNAAYNAELRGWEERIEPRLVTPVAAGAFAPVQQDEQFDVILCNPPWEAEPLERFEQHLDKDEDRQLLGTLLDGLERHLAPGGTLVLLYGPPGGLRFVDDWARREGWAVELVYGERREPLARFVARDEGLDFEVGPPPVLLIRR